MLDRDLGKPLITGMVRQVLSHVIDFGANCALKFNDWAPQASQNEGKMGPRSAAASPFGFNGARGMLSLFTLCQPCLLPALP